MDTPTRTSETTRTETVTNGIKVVGEHPEDWLDEWMMGLANRVRRETPDGTIVTLEPGVTTPHGTAGAAVRIGVEGAGGFHSSFSLNCLRKWVETQEGAELFVRDVIYGFTHGWLAWKTRPWIDDVRRSVRESR